MQSRGDARSKGMVVSHPERQLPSTNQSWLIGCSHPIRAGCGEAAGMGLQHLVVMENAREVANSSEDSSKC